MSTAAFPLSKFHQRAYLKDKAHEELMSNFCSLKPQSVLFHTTIVESFRACGSRLSLGRKLLCGGNQRAHPALG